MRACRARAGVPRGGLGALELERTCGRAGVRGGGGGTLTGAEQRRLRALRRGRRGSSGGRRGPIRRASGRAGAAAGGAHATRARTASGGRRAARRCDRFQPCSRAWRRRGTTWARYGPASPRLWVRVCVRACACACVCLLLLLLLPVWGSNHSLPLQRGRSPRCSQSSHCTTPATRRRRR